MSEAVLRRRLQRVQKQPQLDLPLLLRSLLVHSVSEPGYHYLGQSLLHIHGGIFAINSGFLQPQSVGQDDLQQFLGASLAHPAQQYLALSQVPNFQTLLKRGRRPSQPAEWFCASYSFFKRRSQLCLVRSRILQSDQNRRSQEEKGRGARCKWKVNHEVFSPARVRCSSASQWRPETLSLYRWNYQETH